MVITRQPPLYRQVAARLSADLGPTPTSGQRLPSERALCEKYQVSRITLRAALSLLADEGTITSSAARGWFVAATPPSRDEGDSIMGFSQLAATHGQTSSARVLSARLRPATLDEAEAFTIVPGALIFDLRRLRFLEDLVIAVDCSRVPHAVCPTIHTHDFSTTSLYWALRTAPDRVVPSGADYAVEAMPPSAEEAELLDLPDGIPLLVASQRTRDQHGRTVELGRTSYRGDRFRFRASLGSAA